MDFDLAVYPLRFGCEALTLVHLGAQAGSQIRGALWEVLRDFACTSSAQRGQPEHSLHCPMCFILAMEANSARGMNPARPLVIRPPLPVRAGDDMLFYPGDSFNLELLLIGRAAPLFPYVAQGVQRMGHTGIGFGRGRYLVQRIQLFNPFKGSAVNLLTRNSVAMPQNPVSRGDIAGLAGQMAGERLRLRFLTPTQLTSQERTLARPDIAVLVMRLLERLQALELHYGRPAPHEVWESRHHTLAAVAQQMRIVRDDTRWIRVRSGSKRANRMQDLGGFVGEMLLEGEVSSLTEWLLWGTLVNIGKNAVKGNGRYEIDG